MTSDTEAYGSGNWNRENCVGFNSYKFDIWDEVMEF